MVIEFLIESSRGVERITPPDVRGL